MYRVGIVAIVLIGGACKNSGEKAPEPEAKATEAPAASRSAPEAPKVDAEKDALAALDAWLAAQRGGSIDAYMALYDTSFVGVRRTSDGKTVELDHAGWKADRAKMLADIGVRVAFDAPKATVLDGGDVEVRFVQRYANDKYSDHGEKVIRFHRDAAGALKIVREEMVTSEKGWSKATPGLDLRPYGVAAHIDLPTGASAALLEHEYGKVAWVYNSDEAYQFHVYPEKSAGNFEARQAQERQSSAEAKEVGDDPSRVIHEKKTTHGWEFAVSWTDHASCNDPDWKCVDCFAVEVWREDLGLMCESMDSCPTKKQYQAILDACRTLAP